MTTSPDRSLRILMVSDEWRPYIGGAGHCMELFAKELAARGHQLAVATAWHAEAPAFEERDGVAIHRIRDLPSRARWISEDRNRHTPPPFPDPDAIRNLRRLINRFQPDVIPAYGWLVHSLAAALAGKRIPMIVWGHEYGNVCAMRSLFRLEREICSGPAPLKCLHCSIQGRGAAKGTVAAASVLGVRPLLRRKTSAIHSVSRYVATVLERDLNVPDTPSVVIPNFHEEDTGAPDQAILDSLPDGPHILFVGALRRIKGIHELIDAYARLESPPPLVMVGIRTPDTPDTFPPGITVLNDIPHPTVMAMWDSALFGVLPSKAAEPLATVVHEAMSRGRPVIGTTPGGHEDMIDDGETGLIVPAGDATALSKAMAKLLADDALRERMGREALKRARRFTREEVVPQLERFYLETVERERHSA